MLFRSEYRDGEIAKLEAAGKDAKASSLMDRVECINELCTGIPDLTTLRANISRIFSDEVKGITLSSVHRAKGLEADRVFILNPELMPFPRAKQDWEMVQEANLQYVAYTRAKKELIFVQDDHGFEKAEDIPEPAIEEVHLAQDIDLLEEAEGKHAGSSDPKYDACNTPDARDLIRKEMLLRAVDARDAGEIPVFGDHEVTESELQQMLDEDVGEGDDSLEDFGDKDPYPYNEFIAEEKRREDGFPPTNRCA